jgi:hypothetical protein
VLRIWNWSEISWVKAKGGVMILGFCFPLCQGRLPSWRRILRKNLGGPWMTMLPDSSKVPVAKVVFVGAGSSLQLLTTARINLTEGD